MMQAVEFVLMEEEAEWRIPHPRCVLRVHARVHVRSRLRRQLLELEIADFYFLVVRVHRPRSCTEYVIDLRFVEGKPQVTRLVAWHLIAATLVLASIAGVLASQVVSGSATDATPTAFASVAGLALVTALLAAYRTREIVTLHSLVGRAKLIDHVSGLRSARELRPFFRKLAAHTRIAATVRRSARAEHLRDEMREHLRLHEAGVLTHAEYEASKLRILAAHSRRE